MNDAIGSSTPLGADVTMVGVFSRYPVVMLVARGRSLFRRAVLR
ncbi:MAG: hypothetical protein ACRDF6_09660 [bacterium]